jgi:hypothetical protein
MTKASAARMFAELKALKAEMLRANATPLKLAIVNDPECFDDDPEIQAWLAEPWDGISTIEIGGMAPMTQTAPPDGQKEALEKP